MQVQGLSRIYVGLNIMYVYQHIWLANIVQALSSQQGFEADNHQLWATLRNDPNPFAKSNYRGPPPPPPSLGRFDFQKFSLIFAPGVSIILLCIFKGGRSIRS